MIEVYPGGSKYDGSKKDGKREGFGKLFYHDGGMYKGEWRNNEMNG